ACADAACLAHSEQSMESVAARAERASRLIDPPPQLTLRTPRGRTGPGRELTTSPETPTVLHGNLSASVGRGRGAGVSGRDVRLEEGFDLAQQSDARGLGAHLMVGILDHDEPMRLAGAAQRRIHRLRLLERDLGVAVA